MALNRQRVAAQIAANRPFNGREVQWTVVGVVRPAAEPSPEYVRAMRDRDARDFWASAAAARPTPQGSLTGSRYVGGSSVRARA